MGGVDVPDAPVRVVVAVGARTEGAVIPQGWGAPVVVIMTMERKIKLQHRTRGASEYVCIMKIIPRLNTLHT